MKISPLMLALAAGGVAAFLLLRPRTVQASPAPGLLDRAVTLGGVTIDALGQIAWGILPSRESVKATVDSGFADTVDYLRRIDPRPDPLANVTWWDRLREPDYGTDPITGLDYTGPFG